MTTTETIRQDLARLQTRLDALRAQAPSQTGRDELAAIQRVVDESRQRLEAIR